MLEFILGLLIGGTLGFLMAAMCALAASAADRAMGGMG